MPTRMEHGVGAGRIAPLVVCLLLVGAYAWTFLGLFPFSIVDDAFIHFRIVRNLLEHGVPFYNVDERIMSTSSPGWTWSLVAIRWALGLDDIVAAFILNAVAVFAAGYATFQIAGRSFGLAAAALFAAGSMFIVLAPALMLMESAVPAALLAMALHDKIAGRDRWIAFLGLAALFRYEYALILAAASAFELFVRRGRPTRAMFIAAGLCAAGLGLAFYFFGTVIPFPVIAKAKIYDVSLQSNLVVAAKAGAGTRGYWFTAAIACLGILLSLSVWRVRGFSLSHIIFGSGIIIAAAYALSGSIVFRWYVPNYAFPLYIGALTAICTGAFDSMGRTYRRAALLLAAVSILPYVVRYAKESYAGMFNPLRSVYVMEGIKAQGYLEAGRELYREKPTGVLMAPEIGALGYEFQGYLIDAVGLVSPGALAHHPLRVPEERSQGDLGSIPPSLVREQKPDFIVTYAIFAEALVRDSVLDLYRCECRMPALGRQTRKMVQIGALLICRRR